MAATTSFLKFEEMLQAPGLKTKKWAINSSRTDENLGRVFFHAPWRRYVWSMNPGTIFDLSCTLEVTEFLKAHQNDRNT